MFFFFIKVRCDGCKKPITRKNISRHRRTCKKVNADDEPNGQKEVTQDNVMKSAPNEAVHEQKIEDNEDKNKVHEGKEDEEKNETMPKYRRSRSVLEF